MYLWQGLSSWSSWWRRGGGYNANVPSILSTKKKEIPRLMMIYQKKSQFKKHRSAVRRGEDRAVTWWYPYFGAHDGQLWCGIHQLEKRRKKTAKRKKEFTSTSTWEEEACEYDRFGGRRRRYSESIAASAPRSKPSALADAAHGGCQESLRYYALVCVEIPSPQYN